MKTKKRTDAKTKELILAKSRVWKGSVRDFCKSVGIPTATFYKWKAEANPKVIKTKSGTITVDKEAFKPAKNITVLEPGRLKPPFISMKHYHYITWLLLVTILYKIW